MKSLLRVFVYLIFFSSMLLSDTLESKTIAFAQDTMANDFRKAQVFEVRDAIKQHDNMKFVYSDANGSTALLIRQIEKFIIAKVDLLIVGTNDAKTVVPVISKAYNAGVPVIILDRGIIGEQYTTFINSDNLKIGKLGAQYIAKELQGKGTVLLFEGIQQADVTQLRSKGFLDEIAKSKDINVIKRTGNYLRKDAIIEMEKLLKNNIHIDAIFSESDSMLSGVRSVMKRYAQDPKDIVTVGCDYTTEAKNAIISQEQSASVLFPLGGDKAVEIALDILNGKSVPKHLYIPIKLVTQKNVQKIKPIF